MPKNAHYDNEKKKKNQHTTPPFVPNMHVA
jgi:hypothetical protein